MTDALPEIGTTHTQIERSHFKVHVRRYGQKGRFAYSQPKRRVLSDDIDGGRKWARWTRDVLPDGISDTETLAEAVDEANQKAKELYEEEEAERKRQRERQQDKERRRLRARDELKQYINVRCSEWRPIYEDERPVWYEDGEEVPIPFPIWMRRHAAREELTQVASAISKQEQKLREKYDLPPTTQLMAR